MRTRKIVDWVTGTPPQSKRDGMTMRCERCGRERTLDAPIAIPALCMYAEAFSEEHRFCKVQEPPRQ